MRAFCTATERSPPMHRANASWMTAWFSMKEKVLPVTSEM